MSLKGSKKVKANPNEVELQKIAQEEWADYQEVYVPVENELIRKVMQFGSPERVAKARGEAAGAIRQTSQPATRQPGASQGLTYRGLVDAATAESRGAGAGGVAAEHEELARADRGGTGLINLGRQVQGLSGHALRSAASNQAAVDRAIRAREQAERAQNLDLVGFGLGAAGGLAYDKFMDKGPDPYSTPPYAGGRVRHGMASAPHRGYA